MRKKEFTTKPDEKTVVAVMDASRCGVTDEVAKKCTRITMHMVYDMILNDYRLKIPKLEIPYGASYHGVAICDKNDDYDERTGKEIAGSKADIKYHIAIAKKYKRLADIFEKAQEEMYILEANHALAARNIKDRLSKYYS